MELLVLKVGGEYIRVLADGHELVGLNKASVFPFADEEKVLGIYNDLKLSYTDVTIKKLVITETSYFNENNA
uniref:hypothetical protein n=1 Tax=uncultured Draconibacterium sp. TaxID=1573823 RepID=UPI003217396A